MKTSGFTLIELMIVISVISLLSTVTFYASSDAKSKAEDSHMKVEADQVKKAILIRKASGYSAPLASGAVTGTFYRENSDEYRDSMDILVNGDPSNPNDNGGYLSEIPTSPDGDSYYYAVSDNGQAVFAADLNTEDTGGSNTCSIIEPSESGTGNPDNPCSYNGHYPGTCSSPPPDWTTYQLPNPSFPNQEICVDVQGTADQSDSELLDNCRCSYGELSSIDPGTPLDVCEYYFNSNCTWKSNWPTSGSHFWACAEETEESSGSICDGSSNSDYCSCIE
jgi:prepilin-type N-terminal cleavage/methylation domain-containing protein